MPFGLGNSTIGCLPPYLMVAPQPELETAALKTRVQWTPYALWHTAMALLAVATAVLLWSSPFLIVLWIPFGLVFGLILLCAGGYAIVLAVRCGLRRWWFTMAIYGLAPVTALAVFVACSSATLFALDRYRLYRFELDIEIANRSGTVVHDADEWIDPTYPARARLLTGRFFTDHSSLIYDEVDGSPWLQRYLTECTPKPVKLKKHFYYSAPPGRC